MATENVTHRRRALDSFRSILDFLSDKDNLSRFVRVGDRFELNLEKNVPNNPYHRNLILIFEPTLTSGGAKFSLRSDGRFTITIFVQFRNSNKDFWIQQFPRYVRDWFLSKRSSYVHEFTHYLDIREHKELDKIVAPDPRDNKAYFNHPWEVNAYIQQGLADIEDAVEVKLLNKWKNWVREFGMTDEQFVKNALRKYFNSEFVRYLSPENQKLVEDELKDFYKKLLPSLREWIEGGMDGIVGRVTGPPMTVNGRLKQIYVTQKNQEEADMDMSKKASMQHVMAKEHLEKYITKTVSAVMEQELPGMPGNVNLRKPFNKKVVDRIKNLALYGMEDNEILDALSGEIDNKLVTPRWVKFIAKNVRAGTLDEAFGAKDSNTKDGKEWKEIKKLEKEIQVMPDDEPDQKKQPVRQMKDMFPHAENLGGTNQQFGESSTFGSDSFQGGAFGFGGKQQLADPERHVPPEQDDTAEMQLPSSRERGGLNNPNSGPDKFELGSKDLTDDDEGLRLYNSLSEFLDSLEEQMTVAGAEDFSMSTTGGASQTTGNKTPGSNISFEDEGEEALKERTESDALYRDLHGMAIDPDANDKNFDPEPPAPEEYGSAHHVGGLGKIMAPHKFVPEHVMRLHKRNAEEQAYRTKLKKLGKL